MSAQLSFIMKSEKAKHPSKADCLVRGRGLVSRKEEWEVRVIGRNDHIKMQLCMCGSIMMKHIIL